MKTNKAKREKTAKVYKAKNIEVPYVVGETHGGTTTSSPLALVSPDLIEYLGDFFEKSAKSIYDKVSILGSCPMKTADSAFAELKNTLKIICKFALNAVKTTLDNNGLFSVSICLKVKTQATHDSSTYIEGYATPCAFVSTDTENLRADTDKCNSAKTQFKQSQYNFINDEIEAELPHHGLSFSERFIENIEFYSDKIITGTYDLSEGFPYKYYKDKDEIAEIFNDGSNKNSVGEYNQPYPNPKSLIQHRNEVAFFPIVCKTSGKTKRVGYMQITAYYNSKRESVLSQNQNLDKILSNTLEFYTNWALLASKIANINKLTLKSSQSIVCDYE